MECKTPNEIIYTMLIRKLLTLTPEDLKVFLCDSRILVPSSWKNKSRMDFLENLAVMLAEKKDVPYPRRVLRKGAAEESTMSYEGVISEADVLG